MDFLLKHFKFYWVTYTNGGKESTSIQLLVYGLNSFKEFHKDRFLVPCCLIFTTMIYIFCIKRNWYLQLCRWRNSISLWLKLEMRFRKVRTQSELAIAWFEMNYIKVKGNAQFVQRVTFEPSMDFKQIHYGSYKYYKSCWF